MLSLRVRICLLAFFAFTLLFFFRHEAAYTVTGVDIHNGFPLTKPPHSNLGPPPPHGDSDWPEHLQEHVEEDDASQLLWSARAESVKKAFLHAYQGYERYAPFPADELKPTSNGSVQNFNGWGVTMVDSLDTMLLLGLDDEYERAVSQVASINFTMPASLHAPFFETIIRYLGGFLSAYALSNEPIMLSRADELATRLLPAFNTTNGVPMYAVNPHTKELRGGSTMFFSEIASCQMEYKYLAHLTGRAEYFTKVDKIMDLMVASQTTTHGMWPTLFDISSGMPANGQYSVGAFSDSGYEYLLKQYLLSGKTEHRLAEMYMKSMTGVIENLIYLSHTRNLLYITDTIGMVPTRKFEHLSCFFPGLLVLGATTLPDSIMSPQQKELHMWAAEGLAHTCWVVYVDQPSGLGPEIVAFENWGPNNAATWPERPSDNWKEERWMAHVEAWEEGGRDGGKPPGVGNAGMPVKPGEGEKLDYMIWTPSYLLRPETLESMFVMYRATKDPKWRDRGWQIWEAIESKTRTPSGYTSVYGVDIANPTLFDSMPSYFLAETVKYAYLLALDDDPWPADAYILNTEAHPLPVFSWRDWERQQYGIGVEPSEPSEPEVPHAENLHAEDLLAEGPHAEISNGT